jgi:hypothetical protein
MRFLDGLTHRCGLAVPSGGRHRSVTDPHFFRLGGGLKFLVAPFLLDLLLLGCRCLLAPG